jgi:hypothetical protein
VFWGWIGHGIVEAILCAYIPPLILENSSPQQGMFSTFLESGALTFTAIVFIANIKLMFIQTVWHWAEIVIILLSIGMWFVVAAVVDVWILIDYDIHGVRSLVHSFSLSISLHLIPYYEYRNRCGGVCCLTAHSG